MKKIIIFIGLIISLISYGNGYSSVFNVDFASSAMGSGSVMSVDIDDFQSVLTNPSLLPIPGWNFAKFSYYKYLEDTNFSYVGTGIYIEGYGNIGFSFLYGDYGYQEGRDGDGNYLDSFSSRDIGVILTLADSISQYTYAGLNIKYLSSEIGEYQTEALLFDLGLSFKVKKWLLGMYVKNWGTSIEYQQFGDFSSVIAGMGIRYKKNFSNSEKSMTLLSDFSYINDEMKVDSGFIFGITKSIGIRAGLSDIFQDFSRKINCGIYANISKLKVDLSYSYNANIPSTLSAGLGFKW